MPRVINIIDNKHFFSNYVLVCIESIDDVILFSIIAFYPLLFLSCPGFINFRHGYSKIASYLAGEIFNQWAGFRRRYEKYYVEFYAPKYRIICC